jgi:hypothetical protein
VNEARFAGRMAVVTGAGSGIGRAAALRLAWEGARVGSACATRSPAWRCGPARRVPELGHVKGGSLSRSRTREWETAGSRHRRGGLGPDALKQKGLCEELHTRSAAPASSWSTEGSHGGTRGSADVASTWMASVLARGWLDGWRVATYVLGGETCEQKG